MKPVDSYAEWPHGHSEKTAYIYEKIWVFDQKQIMKASIQQLGVGAYSILI